MAGCYAADAAADTAANHTRRLLAEISLGFARELGDFGATVMVAGNIPGRTQTVPNADYDAVRAWQLRPGPHRFADPRRDRDRRAARRQPTLDQRRP